jgi:hypothetical protein
MKVPQWIPRNWAARKSRQACSASSGEMWTGFAVARGVYEPMGRAARSNGPSSSPVSLK